MPGIAVITHLLLGETQTLIEISDNLSITEEIAQSATIDIAETLSLLESIDLSATIEILDALVLSESIDLTATITVSDQLTLDISDITIYEFTGVEFGGIAFPYVQKVRVIKPRFFSEQPIPKREQAYREDLGGLGDRITVRGYIYPDVYSYMGTLRALSDGTARTLDLKVSGGPTWTAILDYLEFSGEAGDPRIEYYAVFAERDNP